MEYTYLGRIGLRVSRLCLGTVNFGRHASEKDAFSVMSRALQAGINFFDTANIYNEGLTETIVGNWLTADKSRRDQIVLATKLYGKTGEGPNDGRLSAYHIRRACEDSLRRLQTDHIDLYQMHHVDRRTPWDEIWQGMEQLVREGKILYVGSSNFAAWDIARAQGIAAQRNFLGLVSEQSVYNLRSRTIELEVLPCCRELGLGVIPYSPMGGGLLCGVLDNPTTGRRGRESLRQTIERHRSQLEAYEELCASIGQPPANVALAWVLSNSDITAPIIGPRTVKQLADNLSVLELELDDEILTRLDEIWTGPGGEAPEAYAW
ncbi:MAG: aldo/keto reductase [Candidatus Poribacteria bacterium]|nr:aldo/keto reductase [Candidatus Poribacteria bacterium]